MTADSPDVATTTDTRSELDILDPVPTEVTLLDGTVVTIKELKARQFFRLLRIITHGAASMLAQLNWTQKESPDAFASQLVAVIVFAVPEAEQESIDFIQSMVSAPEDPEENARLFRMLEDPELEDVITIIENVVNREAEDLVALGKRMAKWWSLAQKTGQLKAARTTSSEAGPGPSTSSPANTAGATNGSSTSPSAESGKSPKQSAAAGI